MAVGEPGELLEPLGPDEGDRVRRGEVQEGHIRLCDVSRLPAVEDSCASDLVPMWPQAPIESHMGALEFNKNNQLTKRSAKPLFVGSVPTRASILKPLEGNINHFFSIGYRLWLALLHSVTTVASRANRSSLAQPSGPTMVPRNRPFTSIPVPTWHLRFARVPHCHRRLRFRSRLLRPPIQSFLAPTRIRWGYDG